MDLKELGAVDPHTHWYYRAKAAAVVRAIHTHVLPNCSIVDVGAGSGFFAERVRAARGTTSVICYDPHYSDDQIGERGGIAFQRELSSENLKEAKLILMIDVLEHVENDSEFLNEITRDATNGSVFVLTVPAFMSLWGKHDEFLGHYRRYRLHELEKLVERAGLIIEQSRYLFRVIFPFVWVIRRFRKRSNGSDLTTVPRAVNMVLRMACTIDNILPVGVLPGVSVLVLAKKPTSGAGDGNRTRVLNLGS